MYAVNCEVMTEQFCLSAGGPVACCHDDTQTMCFPRAAISIYRQSRPGFWSVPGIRDLPSMEKEGTGRAVAPMEGPGLCQRTKKQR